MGRGERRGKDACPVEVDNEHLVLTGVIPNENIREVEVRMKDAVLMHGVDRLQDFVSNNLPFLNWRFGLQPFPPVKEPLGFTSDEGSSIQSKRLPLNPSAQDFNRRNTTFASYDCRAEFCKGAWWTIPIQVVHKMANQAPTLIASDDSRALGVERNALDYASSALKTVSLTVFDFCQSGPQCPPVAVFEPPATGGGICGKSFGGGKRTEDGEHRTRDVCVASLP